MNALPDGWTDDLRIAIEPERTEELVNYIFDGHLNYAAWEPMCSRLMQDFGLSADDAYLAIDRVQGGMVRAVTGNPENRPDPIKDPLAHMSFQRIWTELPRRHIFSRRRKSDGKWAAWFKELTSEQAGAGQPATRSESDSEGGDKPQPEAEGRSR